MNRQGQQRTVDGLLRRLHERRSGIASVATIALLSSGLLITARSLEPDGASFASPNGPTAPDAQLPGVYEDPDGTLRYADGSPVRFGSNGEPLPQTGPRSTPTHSGTQPPNAPRVTGVTDDTIEVVYYWKGERTRTSPFLKGTAAEGANLDEAEAFHAYIDYVNAHANGGATFFGLPINLHGRRLVGHVEAPKDAASGDFVYAQMAEKIAKELQPFAAVASHGSLSSYICPYLARFGIFNMQTYDLGGLGGDLQARTNGYCTPAGLTWERQVDLTIGYLRQQMHEPYERDGVRRPRKYGVIYTVYPGLRDVGDAMVQRMKDAGIPVVAHARLPDSLAQSQTEASGVLLKMRQAGVNTLVMPDAGAPLTITHAAQAQEYFPEYYVWPCSGADTSGMVRLFQPTQWEGAEGLTCYDREFNPDAVNHDLSRRSEWWRAYREVRPNAGEPPAPSPLVYAGLFQLVAGISGAGRDLTPDTFQAALDRIPMYRYDALEGRTSDPTNMLVSFRERDRSFIGDVAYLRWSTLASEGGAQGAYVYPRGHRYRVRSDF